MDEILKTLRKYAQDEAVKEMFGTDLTEALKAAADKEEPTELRECNTFTIERDDGTRVKGEGGKCPRCGAYRVHYPIYGKLTEYCSICGQHFKWKLTAEEAG